jgi:asparagine synthase (glutamine-hydrolysing)
MCGIVGVVELTGRPVERPVLERMTGCLVHRGPDGAGYYVDGLVGLGQRRLAVIDLATGDQPMGDEDGSVWVTFNGEIYNFRDLRGRLASSGHRFRTGSDTEVIVHGYEQWGVDCVRHFRGMFAFVLWDGRERLLFAARDRVGKKPLFYTVAGGRFLAASELQALLQHPSVDREVDWTALDDYLLYGYVPAPKTIFRGIHKLPPAHRLVFRPRDAACGGYRLEVERYWQIAYEPKLCVSEEEAIEGLREVLGEAVRLRLIADVPLGALLSGGVDSGTVVALMAGLSQGPVRTFSVGFEDQGFDELRYARAVAARYATDHREMVVRPDAVEVLPRLVRHYGEPYADSSALPTYYVARMARQFVTVALNGDGGDECFAGYDRYAATLLAEQYRRLPGWLRGGLLERAGRLLPEGLPPRHPLRRARRFLESASLPLGPRYIRWVSTFPGEGRRALYSPDLRLSLDGYRGEGWLLSQIEAFEEAGLHPTDLQLAADVHSYLPYDLLVKMDIATMANSLEVRSPFLDHEVLEFCARLPAGFKMRRSPWSGSWTSKYLLKRLAGRLLPRETVHRPKMGFGVPVGAWVRGPLRPFVQEVLLSARARARGYFRPEAVEAMLQDHLEGRRDYAFQLWALLWLELWHWEFIDHCDRGGTPAIARGRLPSH